MRSIKEVLRLRFHAQLSIRKIRSSTNLSVGAIQKIIQQAEQLEIGWPLPPDMDEAELERRFYPSTTHATVAKFEQPDFANMHRELRRKGMTKQLLWEEYKQHCTGKPYRYSQYCERYRRWAKTQKRSMRQTHRAGEKAFIDYAGPTIPVIDSRTGEVMFEANVFVAVLGASNYTFAEATRSQSLPDWLGSHVRMFEYFGGVCEILVPDNLRSATARACRYDPDTNPSYQQLAEHYEVAVIQARPYKPRDKAKAEVGVQIVERWIMMRLRHFTFFSLGELNNSIRELLEDLNMRPFKQMPGNRCEAFEQLDKPALKALPKHAYEYVDIKRAKVNIDYHVQYNDHHYSVPHQYVGERVEVHGKSATVQIFFRAKLLATHVKQSGYGYATKASHMPERHAAHQKWTPKKLSNWAKIIGPDTQYWVDAQIGSRDHPEQAYKACLGLLSLSREYSDCRLNAACKLANKEGLVRLRQVKSVLQSNRDKLVTEPITPNALPQAHENVRGAESFAKKTQESL